MAPTTDTEISYVVPLKWSDDAGLDELVSYLRWLSTEVAEVIVVDGSEEMLFNRHAQMFAGFCRHLAPSPELNFLMGKVSGVTTGVMAASHEKVVLADDDVRYEAQGLRRAAELLDRAHLVRPQNYFAPMPWHAKLDTARTLLNRVHSGDLEFGAGDFPGTLAIRRSAFVEMGGYDGDVIFENLELMRTVTAAGGVVVSPLDLFVRRVPPSARHFASQRVRQAYDDFAVPVRMAIFLLVLPGAIFATATRRFRALGVGTASTVALAELGRRRAGGRGHFPALSAVLAPAWVLERGVSAWLAVFSRLVHGGIRYSDGVISRSATSKRKLRERLGPVVLRDSLRSEPDSLVGPVAERVDAGAPAAAEGHGAPS